MIVDPLSVKYSPKRAYQTVPSDQLNFIEGWKSALTSVGWTLTESLYATFVLDFPLGLPVVDGLSVSPKAVINCAYPPFVSVGSAAFTLYDPGKQQPPSNAPCGFIPIQTTALATAIEIATFIAAGTGFNATAAAVGLTGYQITLKSKTPGALGNGVQMGASATWSDSNGPATGGGYTLTSANGASVYQCTLTYQVPNIGNPGGLQFAFALNGGTPANYQLQGFGEGLFSGANVDSYSIVCNGYGFAIFDGPDHPSVGDSPFRQVSLFAMAPYIPPGAGDSDIPYGETFGPAYAVCIFGTGYMQTQTYYNRGCTTCLDSYANTYALNSGGFPRLLALRSPGQPLNTPAARPLVIGAYVQFGRDSTSTPYVIGKLWDCIIAHDFVPSITFNGQRFIAISSQTVGSAQQASTLLMMAPPAQIHRSGTVSTANGPPGKASIFFGSGQDFTGLNAGDPITINGVPNIIDSITSNLALIVVHPIIPPLISVPYTSP